ncbi:MAG TPA: SDR family NAD(P)-dependent oxidoreductase, partial [bacterium]|nr:SDR family NAD(P)-dependent oxidoreductase [bacterium]
MPTALVTGSTDGIGLETARQLQARGWRVVVHGRDRERAGSALKALARAGGGEASAVWGDLASMPAVLDLAAQAGRAAPALDVLMLNAGVYEANRALSPDGFERTMGINHFAHLLLSLRLRGALKAAAAPRVIWVSSGVHRGASLDLGDLDLARDWSGYGAYAASKLANAVSAAEMARRPDFEGVVSVSLHPGVVGTKLLTRNFGKGGVPIGEG